MQRPPPSTAPVHLRFDEFELDEAGASLRREGRTVALAPTPFNVLCALARQPGVLLTKVALLDAVWGHRFVSESVLKTAISDLRIAIGDNPREPRVIETVPRRGYRFIAAVSAAVSTGATAAATPSSPVTPTVAAPGSSASADLRSFTPDMPVFVGRIDMLDRLQRAWGRAATGRRAVVWIAGEPGIGKTTLMERFVSGIGTAPVARGQCVEPYGMGEPYLPVLEALADLCRRDPSLPELLRAVAPTWLLQLPWLNTAAERDGLRRELAGAGPDRMLREMGELLDRCTEQHPLLLVTEDLHWSDRATIQLIDHVARRRGPACLMWLATFRVAEVVAMEHPLNALRRELRLHGLCEEMVLDPFSEAEVAELVAGRSAALGADETFVRALHERTDGVPLFVSSVLAQALTLGGDAPVTEATLAATAVPENLTAIIDHYIDRLTMERRTLLAAAAVCGVDFRIATLARVLGRDAAALALDCDALGREQVWLAAARPDDDADPLAAPQAFRHALFRQVLYERTPPVARADLHRRVGEALAHERAGGAAVAASEVAMHLDRGRQPLTAARHYAQAAESALMNFGPAACIGFVDRGQALLRQVPPGTERDTLEIGFASLQGISLFQLDGVGDAAAAAFEHGCARLEVVPDHPLRGHLLHGYGYLLTMRGDYARALEVAARAETLAAASDDPVLMLVACFVHGGVSHLQGRTATARERIEQGLAIAARLDMPANDVFAADPQVSLLGMLAIEAVRGGRISEGRQHLERARQRAQALHQPMTRLAVAWHEALLEVRLGNTERLAEVAEDMQALVEQYALGQGRAACRWFRGWAEARRGQPRQGAERILEAAEQNTRLGMRAGSSEVLGYAAEALLLAGDPDGAETRLSEALQVVDTLGERVYLPQLLQLEAALLRARGRHDAATAAARRAVDEAKAQDAPWLELQALAALCRHDTASAEDRRALAERIAAMPEAQDTPLLGQPAQDLP